MRILSFSGVATILIALSMTGCAIGQFRGWFVEERAPDALFEEIKDGVTVYKPDGDGPFPAVIAFHGCAKPHNRADVYAKAANSLGVAFLTVDSYGPRGVSEMEAQTRVCSGQTFWGRERAGDALVALDHARSLSFVDKDRIALLGWSHGGWTVMDLMSMDLETTLPTSLSAAPEEGLSGVTAVLLYYPYCGTASRSKATGWPKPIPARFVLVENDALTKEGQCVETIERLKADGVEAEYEILKGVTHGFDENHEPGSRLRYAEEEAAYAVTVFAEFLNTYLVAETSSDS